MKCVLVSPPFSSPFSPPLGVLSVGAYLRAQGVEVAVIDASIDALHHRLAPERTPPAARELLREIRTADGFRLDPARHDAQLEAIDGALTLSTGGGGAPALRLGGYDEPVSSFAPGADPFLGYYGDALVPAVAAAAPDVIGISIGYHQQAAFAAAIIAELGRALPGVPIVTGGAFVSSLCVELRPPSGGVVPLVAGRPSQADLLASLIDTAAVGGEGEAPMAEICRAIAGGRPLDGIPGSVRVDRASRALEFAPEAAPLTGAALPSLDLSGLPIGRRYLGRVRAAPLMASRGCYWNRCAFCDHAALLDSRFRELPLETVLATLRRYRGEHGIEYAFFCDEGMAPKTISRLADGISRERLGVRFGTMARFERALERIVPRAAEGGLSFLSFGLEATSPRVLEAMRKGYAPDTALRILDACERCGVAVELFVMFGFPGETREEAQATVRFLEENAARIAVLRPNPWYLTLKSPIGADLARFGVVPVAGGPVSNDPSTYRLERGMGFEESAALVRSLRENPVLGDKIVHSYFNEEYFALRGPA